jgi:hypothetical protein
MDMMKLQIRNGPMLYCFDHPNKEIEFYCRLHNELLCCLCVWEHSEHKSLVKVCIPKDLRTHTEDLKVAMGKMQEGVIDRIKHAREQLQKLKEARGKVLKAD